MNQSPYLPFPEDPEFAAKLTLVKHAADTNACSENTLRSNAKARRLPAYQQRVGAPVYVIPDEVAEGLLRKLEKQRKESIEAFEQAARRQPGYKPLVLNALDYARQGITTLGEAMRLSGWVE